MTELFIILNYLLRSIYGYNSKLQIFKYNSNISNKNSAV